MVRRLTTLLFVTLAASTVLVGQAGDVNKVLADMWAAIGGALKIAAVKTLTAAGATRSPQSASTIVSETTLAMALPDKYVVRRMLTPVIGVTYRSTGFNGDGVINETEVPPDPSRRVLIRTPGMVWPSGPLTPGQKAAQMIEAKHDFARTALGLFGASFAAFPVQFSYAGQADLAEGKAHVIQVTGADRFDARLYVDSKTNLPLMLTWEDLTPFVATSSTREGSLDDPAVLRQVEATTAQWDRNEAARKVVEYRIYYSNFKIVDGLNLPHTLTRSVDGKVKDTTTFEVIQINKAIEDSRFVISKVP